MKRVLVVEDSRTQALHIQLLLEEVPYQVDLAPDGAAALEMIGRGEPDLVLTDLEMPNLNGLQLVEAVRDEYPWIPVVLMTAHGSEEIAASALSKGAASYIPKANLADDVLPTLQRIFDVTSVHRQTAKAFERLTGLDLHFVIDNDPSFIAPIIGYVNDVTELQRLHDATERMRIGVALQEACLNAIYHGNLEVSSDARQQDEDIYHEIIKTRRTQEPYSARRVYIDVSFTPAAATYTVRDEGSGFDPATLGDPSDLKNLERIGGRGLLLIRTFMDAVSHNAAGNAITMVKRFEKTAGR